MENILESIKNNHNNELSFSYTVIALISLIFLIFLIVILISKKKLYKILFCDLCFDQKQKHKKVSVTSFLKAKHSDIESKINYSNGSTYKKNKRFKKSNYQETFLASEKILPQLRANSSNKSFIIKPILLKDSNVEIALNKIKKFEKENLRNSKSTISKKRNRSYKKFNKNSDKTEYRNNYEKNLGKKTSFRLNKSKTASLSIIDHTRKYQALNNSLKKILSRQNNLKKNTYSDRNKKYKKKVKNNKVNLTYELNEHKKKFSAFNKLKNDQNFSIEYNSNSKKNVDEKDNYLDLSLKSIDENNVNNKSQNLKKLNLEKEANFFNLIKKDNQNLNMIESSGIDDNNEKKISLNANKENSIEKKYERFSEFEDKKVDINNDNLFDEYTGKKENNKDDQ